MGCVGSKDDAVAGTTTTTTTPNNKNNKKVSLAHMDKLTSTAYNAQNPPTDWADCAFLVPHEWLRSEMNAMLVSVAALKVDESPANAWKALNLAKWIVSFFAKVVHLHHMNEEEIYFPFLTKEHKAVIPEKKIGQDHEALMAELAEIETTAKAMVEKNGLNVNQQIATLQQKVPVFVKDMKEHLMEEERDLPGPIRANVTKEENAATIQKIIQAGGIDGLHTELPGVLVSTKYWATDPYYTDFSTTEIPPPILQLALDIFIPNYHNVHCALRDSPTMDDNQQPELKEVPFSPSMLPPPPPGA